MSQTRSLPNHTIHARLVDHTKTVRKRQRLKRNGKESMEVSFNDTRPVKYATMGSIMTVPSGKSTAQLNVSKHMVSLR